MIRQLDTIEDHSKLAQFFKNANTSDDHRNDSFDMILSILKIDEYYRAYANFQDNEIVSACFMRELTDQKAQVMDLLVSRKRVPINKNKAGDVMDYAVIQGEQRGIYRFYTCITEDMLDTVDTLKKNNSVFKWRERYNTYVDEIIDRQCFSRYHTHWHHIMNDTLRLQKKFVRHHILKPEYRLKDIKSF
jgi:hypothetical protein